MTTTPTLFAKLRESRARLIIQNLSANTITLGSTMVTPGIGYCIPPTGDVALPCAGDCLVYGVAASSSQASQTELN